MKHFSRTWKSSTRPSKQRKYRITAPLHLKQKLMRAHLAKPLRDKYHHRALGLKKGDKVKVMRGTFHGKEGAIDHINLKAGKAFIAGIETAKKDGSKAMIPLEPSNLMIIELNNIDKMRQKALERKHHA